MDDDVQYSEEFDDYDEQYLEQEEMMLDDGSHYFDQESNLQEKIANQELNLPARPDVDFDNFEEDDYNEIEPFEIGEHSTKSDEVRYQRVTKKIFEPKGPRWTQPIIEGVTKKTAVKWGTPRYEEVAFPWNKPGAKKPKVKGEGFKKNDHIHSKPSWIGKTRIIAPLPRPKKKKSNPPNKPARSKSSERKRDDRIGHNSTSTPVSKRRAKIVKGNDRKLI